MFGDFPTWRISMAEVCKFAVILEFSSQRCTATRSTTAQQSTVKCLVPQTLLVVGVS